MVRSFTDENLEKSFNVLIESICPSISYNIYWKDSGVFNSLFPNRFFNNNQDNLGEDRRKEAFQLGTDLERKMQEILVKVLKKKYGTNGEEWWVKGVSSGVRSSCSQRWEEENREDEIYSYLYFIDYIKIVEQNQELRQYFLFDSESKNWNIQNKSKDKQFEWLKIINNGPRRKWAHGSKKPPSVEELDFLKEMHAHFIDNYKNNALSE